MLDTLDMLETLDALDYAHDCDIDAREIGITVETESRDD